MPEAERVESMSFVSRLVNIFTAPSKVFQFLSGKPLWVVPLVVITLYAPLLQGIIFTSDTGKEGMRQEIQKSPRAAQLTPEQIDQQISMMSKVIPISTLVIAPVITFALAGLVYFLFSVALGGEVTYKQTLSAWVHVALIGLVGGAVQTGLVFLKGNIKPNTSLAAFLPFLEEDSFVYHFLQTFDIFLLWQLAVLSLGMGMMSRVGTRKAAITLYSTLVVLGLIIAGVRQAFS
jgi:hypothetical protein